MFLITFGDKRLHKFLKILLMARISISISTDQTTNLKQILWFWFASWTFVEAFPETQLKEEITPVVGPYKYCGQFHQHFMRSFFANFLSPKTYNRIYCKIVYFKILLYKHTSNDRYLHLFTIKKNWLHDFCTKKLLVKCWWNLGATGRG